jgi:hypothetical protein
MANAIYPKYKEGLISGGSNLNLSSGNVKAVLVDTGTYTYSASHQFLSDITSGARTATSGNLASKTVTGGVFDSADPTFTAATGNQSEAVVLYVDSGAAGTSPLVAYFDTGVTGLPVTPNGGDINITVNASGWFSL